MKYTIPKVDRKCTDGFRRIAEHDLNLPELDEWKEWSGNELWWELVGGIAVAGGSAGWDNLYDDKEALRKLSITSLRRVSREGNRRRLDQHINSVLKKYKVRFIAKNSTRSRKAESIASNFLNRKIVSGFRFVLVKNLLADLAGYPHSRKDRLAYERRARQLLVSNGSPTRVIGFNMKSASDYLITIGFAREIIPIDSNLRNMTEKICGLEGFGDYQIPASLYEEWEVFFRVIAERLGLEPFELDRKLYATASGWHTYLRE